MFFKRLSLYLTFFVYFANRYTIIHPNMTIFAYNSIQMPIL